MTPATGKFIVNDDGSITITFLPGFLFDHLIAESLEWYAKAGKLKPGDKMRKVYKEIADNYEKLAWDIRSAGCN